MGLPIVFVMGCQRTGSTLMSMILGSHPYLENRGDVDLPEIMSGGLSRGDVLHSVIWTARYKLISQTYPDAKFVLLDWRHDFGGLTHAGDIYYDLAKLYGGTIVSYQLMKDGMFSFNMSGSDVYYDFYTKSNLNDARDEYELFLKSHDFDLNKIKIITALIFLNMSPLHNDPFDHMVYYLGKNMLYKTLRTVNYGKRA